MKQLTLIIALLLVGATIPASISARIGRSNCSTCDTCPTCPAKRGAQRSPRKIHTQRRMRQSVEAPMEEEPMMEEAPARQPMRIINQAVSEHGYPLEQTAINE